MAPQIYRNSAFADNNPLAGFCFAPPANADLQQLPSNITKRSVLPTRDRPDLSWRNFWSHPKRCLADLTARACESDDVGRVFSPGSPRPRFALRFGPAARMHVGFPGVDIAVSTDHGGKTKRNDDAAVICLTTPGDILVGVADGVGSSQHGDTAAKVALLGAIDCVDKSQGLDNAAQSAQAALELVREHNLLGGKDLHTTLSLTLLAVSDTATRIDDINIGDSSDLLFKLGHNGNWIKIQESKMHSVSQMVYAASQILLSNPRNTSKEERSEAYSSLSTIASETHTQLVRRGFHDRAKLLLQAIMSFDQHLQDSEDYILDQSHADFKLWCTHFVLICDASKINKHPQNRTVTSVMSPNFAPDTHAVDRSQVTLDPNKTYLKIKASDCLLDNFTWQEVAILAHGLTDARKVCQVLSEALQAKMRVQQERDEVYFALRNNVPSIFFGIRRFVDSLFNRYKKQRRQLDKWRRRLDLWLINNFNYFKLASMQKKNEQRAWALSSDLTAIIGQLGLSAKEYSTAMRQLEKRVAKMDNQTVVVMVFGKQPT